MTGGPILQVSAQKGWGGGEQQVFLLHRALRTRGLDSLLLCRTGTPLYTRTAGAGLPVHGLPLRGALDGWSLARLVRMLRGRRPALVHTHCPNSLTLAGVAAWWVGRQAAGPPVIAHRRVITPLGRDRFTRWRYTRLITRHLAISQAVRATLVAAGVPAERIQVIPSGVDLAALHAPDAAGPPTHRLADLLGIPRDRPIIGCVANLQPPKSLDTLVAAAARVRATHPEVVFCVLGEGPERPRLERQVQARGLTAGFFLPGFQTDAAALVPEMTAVVLPSRAEGLGTSLLEAMAVSRPVVASRVGGIPEVVTDGTDGLLVPPGDEEALAATLRRLLEDAALRDRLGAAAARRAEAFSADRMVAAVQAVYEDVFGASPSASGEEDSGT